MTPSSALETPPTTPELGDAGLAALARDGYLVAPGLLGPELAAAALDSARSQFPSVADAVADPAKHRLQRGLTFRLFPYDDDVLNSLAFDERILGFVRRALGESSIFLTQGAMRASYPAADSVDQCLHRDYTNNTLLVPSDDLRFGQIAVMLYLTDVTLDNAPLFVCSRSQTDDRPPLPRDRCRDDDPAIYEMEAPVIAPSGTAIFYTMATFHRGSKFHGSDGQRIVMHLNYRQSGCEWMSFTAFGTSFETAAAERLMTSLTPSQREVLGVPAPGHPYWTTATIAGVAARYPGIDMTPYERAQRG